MNARKHIVQIFYALFLLFQVGKSIAQEPAHYFLGEEELSSTDIYSVKQHPNGELFIASNHGLYKYEHGSFDKIEWDCPHTGNSIFSLRLDSQNNLYCINLSGQIFQLQAGKLTPYISVPKKYISSVGVDFTFDESDNIILRSKMYAIYKSGEWSELSANLVPFFNHYDPTNLLFLRDTSTQVYSLSKGHFSLNRESQNAPFYTDLKSRRYPFIFQENLYSINVFGHLTSYNEGTEKYITRINCSILQQTTENQIWALGKTSGASYFELSTNGIQSSEIFFKDYLISAIDVGDDGTLFLGTFGKGIIVIPSVEARVYNTKIAQINHFQILKNQQQIGEVISSNIQKIQISQNEQLIFDLNALYFNEKINFNLSEENEHLLFQVQNAANFPSDRARQIGPSGTLKQVTLVDSNTVLIASSTGIFKIGPGMHHLPWKKNGTGQNWWRLKQEKIRCKTINYISETKELLYASEFGLFRIDKSGKETAVLFNNNQINCTDITTDKKSFICATQEVGILFINDGNVSQQISSTNGLKNDFVQKVLWEDDKLYIASKLGFQIYDMVNRKWNNMGKYSRIINGAIHDFHIEEDKIWLASGNNIISIPRQEIDEEDSFNFTLDYISLGRDTSYTYQDLSATYKESKISVGTRFIGIPFEKDAQIEYRLNEENWNSISATTKKIEFSSLSPNDYNLDVRINYLGEYTHQKTITFQVTPPFWQAWWFYVLILLLTALLIVFIFRIRARRQQKKQQLVTDKLSSELKALRSQMNPHFIFNALNSIQDLVMRQDTKKTYDYIVLFSKLVRNTLNYSSLNFIPIDKEIEFLDVYLMLEKLRFQDEFEYEINYEGCEDYEVPSLLIQPFIENALVHGLLHKKGEKKLSIRFEKGDQLICKITDNGIGREQAKKILTRQRGGHKSFATEAIAQRLQLLNEQSNEKSSYKIIDLYDSGSPCGTKVIILLPLKYHV